MIERGPPNRTFILFSQNIPSPRYLLLGLARTICVAGQKKCSRSLPRQRGRRPGSASEDTTVGIWQVAARPTAEWGKKKRLGEDSRAAPAGKSPACTGRPCPTARVPGGRHPSGPPPPHRRNSSPHRLPVDRDEPLATPQLPTTHRRRPPSSLTPPPLARSFLSSLPTDTPTCDGARFRSAPYGLPSLGEDADPGQRFRERKDPPVCSSRADGLWFPQ